MRWLARAAVAGCLIVAIGVLVYLTLPRRASSVAAGPALPDGTPAVTLSPPPTPAPSATEPTTAFTVVLPNGATHVINTAADCAVVADPWLDTWCVDTVTFTPAALPAAIPPDLHGSQWQAYEAEMDAAFAWAVLNGNTSICSNQAVMSYIAAGMRTPDGHAACLTGLADARMNRTIHMTSPASNVTVTVTLGPA